MTAFDKPLIALTMGDPSSVSSEVIVKYFFDSQPYNEVGIIVVGDLCCIADAINRAKLPLHVNCIQTPAEISQQANTVNLYDLSILCPGSWEYKKPSALNGKAAFSYLEVANSFALNGEIDAIVTMPISKQSLKMARYPYAGNTDILVELSGNPEHSNMLINDFLRVMSVTNHLPFKDVLTHITEERVFKTITHANSALIMCGESNPKIAVCGINPHAAPNCILEREDEEIVLPAINRAKALGLDVSGPMDVSAAFSSAYTGQFDGIISMYHDQTNPAFILASVATNCSANPLFSLTSGVNMTYGLPYIRTSVDYDERFDIAGDGKAEPCGRNAAVKCALKLIDGKKTRTQIEAKG